MEAQEMIDICKKHTMYTWAAGEKVNPIPVERAEGIYFYEPGGKRYLDFALRDYRRNGFGQSKEVREEVQELQERLAASVGTRDH